MAKATTMGPMKIKESASYRVFKVFNAIILTLISVAMLYPFLYLVAQSFSSTQAIVAGQVGLIPKDFNISTYKYVITDGKFIPYYGNTIVYSIIGTVCALLFSALLAYPLSKAELYGGKAINKFIIFTMYFSGGMIPNYILMVSLGLRDTVASFILPGMISTYYVILMRSFFLTLPRELEEAGEIDGLDLWGVFWRIAIPLSKPIIATMTLFYVVQYWNDWFDAFDHEMARCLLSAPAHQQRFRHKCRCRRRHADRFQHQVLRHGADVRSHHLHLPLHPEVFRAGHDAGRR